MSKTKRRIIEDDVQQDEPSTHNKHYEDPEEAADAFLSQWTDEAKPPSEDDAEENVEKEVEDTDAESEDSTEEEVDDDNTEETGEDSEDDTTEDGESDEDETEEEVEETPKKTNKVLEDTSEVEIKVDNEIKKVKVKDLKRLYGMEAALTKKSQQVADQRKEVEAQTVKYSATLDNLYKKAAANWEPYSKIDMLLVSKELTTEEFTNLRKEAQVAHDEFQFVSQEANQFVQQAEYQRKETLKAKAAEALEVLKTKVDWSTELYDKIRTYASNNGIPREFVNQIVDPYAILMLNKARLYDEGNKIVLKKKVKIPTKVIRTGTTSHSDITVDKTKQSMDKLRRTGDSEDAMDAFLSRWQS